MPTMIIKLLTLVALALMPFGMSAASAGSPHHATPSAKAGHCDDDGGQPARNSPDQLAGCTAGCVMFLGEQAAADEPVPAPPQMAGGRAAERWTSRSPEITTPPPKLA